MFDFFKDAYAEINGLDVDRMKDERKNIRKQCQLFNRKTKIIISIVGVLYLVIASTNILMLLKNGFSPLILKYVLLSILDISIIVTMLIKNRKTEIVSIVGIVLFVIINFKSA